MRLLPILPALCLFATIARAEELTRVEQIRALTPEQAAKRLPVRLTGVITYFDSAVGHAFIHDETGAVFFRPGVASTPGAVSAEIGDEVEIVGLTWSGTFSPSVAGDSIDAEGEPGPVELHFRGEGELPDPVTVPFDQLRTGRWHDELVAVRATVRECRASEGEGKRTFMLKLSGSAGQSIEAWGRHLDLGEPQDWIDQDVTLKAVVAGGGDESGQLRNAHLLIGKSSWIVRDTESLEAAFAQPPLAFDQLRSYKSPSAHNRRFRVDGSISFVESGVGFFLSDGDLGLWVGTMQETEFAVGDVVSVAGYLSVEGVTDGIVRINARGTSPAGRIVAPQDLGADEAQGALVSVEGILRASGRDWLSLEGQGGALVRAEGVELDGTPEPGARLLVTGVAEGGQLRLRNAADIVVVESAPWLTETRRYWLFGGIAFLAVVGVLWMVSLRRQVARQTELIQAQTVQATLVEERQRMARELHDSLEQHLIGLHLQIDTLRDRLADSPESLRKLADGVAQMLNHCRDETRRSVFELRTQMLRNEGLAATLVQLAKEANHENGPSVITEISGESTPLERSTQFHLLRCAQEAVANALKHANANEIRICLEYKTDESHLTIADDGRGFEPVEADSPSRPSFGLMHLRERASRIGAGLSIESTPGAGTTITISIPKI